MFLNIVTPCIRPENLKVIAESIKIPRESFRWIVVFDLETVEVEIPSICEVYFLKTPEKIDPDDHNKHSFYSRGDVQRNFATEIISHGHVYYNDDDTSLHPELWSCIKDLDNDFIAFNQAWNTGHLRLIGANVGIGTTDSHNFVVSRELIGETRWRTDIYESDGAFAQECFQKARTPMYLPKILSIFNSLDKSRYVTFL